MTNRVCYVKQNRRSKYNKEKISIITFRTQATNASTTNANIAYDLMSYNMASTTLTIETSLSHYVCIT